MKSFLVTLIAASLFTGAAYAIPIAFSDATFFSRSGTTAGGDLQGLGWGDPNKADHEFDAFDGAASRSLFSFAPLADKIMNTTLKIYLAPFTSESGYGVAKDGNREQGETDAGDYAYGADLSSLADSMFSMKLASVTGDSSFADSEVEIRFQPVP